MRYRTFGRTGWKVSEIGLGGTWFYGRPDEGLRPPEYGAALVQKALDLGINYFDTAPLYGQGRSEEILGFALQGEKRPHYIATKVGYDPDPFNYQRDTVWRCFEKSLQRLRRDRVDLIQIHEAEQAGWEGIFGKGRTLDALREIREQGLARAIGLTGADLTLMARALQTGEFVSVVSYLQYDLLVQTAKETLVPVAAKNQVAVVLGAPLHQGLLGSKRDRWLKQRFAHLRSKLEKIEDTLSNESDTLSRLGLRYILSDPNVTVVLSGAADAREIDDVARASAHGPLASDLIRRIEAC